MARGGFKGGMPNMNNMMKQVQKMQKEMEKAQQKIEETTVTASAGGGVVEVVANGKKEITSIILKPEVVDPEDIDMLQDLILVAVNDAIGKINALSDDEMGKLTGGVNIPGLGL